MTKMVRILIVLVLSALFISGVFSTALADEWPKPPDGWWKSLSPGDMVKVDVISSTDKPTSMEAIIRIHEVDGSMITYSTQTFVNGKEMPERKETAASEKFELNPFPPDSTITKGEEKIIKVGDQSFKCTEYNIRAYNAIHNVCYSSELPVVFNGGNIVLETKSAGFTATMKIKDFIGKKVKTEE